MLSRSDLHAYQQRAIDFIKERKRCALFLDMGMGKGVTTLTAIADLLIAGKFKKVLVIAPLRVANSVWPTEVEKFAHLNHLTVSVCTGTEKQRIDALKTKADIYTINRENIPWLITLCGKSWPFKCVVIDESSSFKTPSSKRFKALKKALPMTDYMVLLTGTPAPNGLLDVWSQMYLIDFGVALGRTYTMYKDRFFIKDYWGYRYEIKHGASEEIHKLMAPHVLSMSADDYLELPERIDIVEPIEYEPSFIKQYKRFEKDMFAQLPDGQEIEALTAATLANKLLQFCNGAAYDENKQWIALNDAKLDALEQIIDDNPTENILLAYNYKFDLERLKARFKHLVELDSKPETIKKWNDGKIRLLAAHPASAGHGINAQFGGSMIVWYGLNWSLELYQQFNARLHRQGQTKPVRIVHLVSKGLLDERVMEVLSQKDVTQKKLLVALK